MKRHRSGQALHQRLRPALGGDAGTPDYASNLFAFNQTLIFLYERNEKQLQFCMQEQEDSVLKSIKLKVVGTENIPFCPKMV